ncbi:hypothetical protein GCM10010302_32290 [Streptomyces polychromogenes]|uniref:Uncharacterized protein n=1 Tax=Streptomyces polychromogenes TaxID=67342 RepID=A0ABN0VEH0_9ACTN
MDQEIKNAEGRRRGAGVRPVPAAGVGMPQAAVICVVLVLAAVMRLYGLPAAEVFRLLAGAAGIGVVVVFTLTAGGRGVVAAAARAVLQSGR